MEKKLACLVMAVLMALGLFPGAAWAADNTGMLKTGDQYEHVRALQAGLSMPGCFSAAGNTRNPAVPPKISNAHAKATESDADDIGLLHACRPGDRGDAVAALQRRLKSLEYYDYSRITGYYGPVTREAVRRFQRVNGLAANGVASPETMELLA